MGKMKELSTMLDELITCGETLTRTAMALKEYFSDTSEPEPETKKKAPAKKKQEAEPEPAKKDPEPEKKISKEDVRKVLAEVSQAGHRNEVIELLKSHGADNITALAPELYETIIKEAEGLKDA